MAVLREPRRELADRRRLPGSVDTDDEDHPRQVTVHGERRRLAEEKLDLLRERVGQRPELTTRLEPAHELGRGRDPDIAANQRLFETLQCFIVSRIERDGDELLRQRPTALAERIPQPREEALALVAVGGRLLVAQQL